jgi:glucosylceramidase
VLTSANLTQAMAPAGSIAFSGTPVPHAPVIGVKESVRYQRIKGVGGALTDTSAWLMYDQLAPGVRAWLMRRLFGPTGIDLRFIRIPMGAADFTSGRAPFSYDDMPAGQTDTTLAHFAIAHDLFYVIPALKQALALDPRAFVMATPWSPPAWMKTNDRLGNPLNAVGFLRQIDYAPYAQYFVKFLKAYAGQGVHIDAITPQNEPGIHTIYPGLTMNAANEAQFVASDLEPALRGAGLRTKIYGYDSNWFQRTTGFAYQLLQSPAAEDLAGLSSHCYFGEPTFMTTVHLEEPRLDQIVSECSTGNRPFSTSELEIAPLRNCASSVNTWNIALDPQGGPVQPPNDGCKHCTGLVTIGPGLRTVTFTRDYYQLGQLSKYVQPGAVRIQSNNFVSYDTAALNGNIASPGLDDVAFRTPTAAACCSHTTTRSSRSHSPARTTATTANYKLTPGETGTFI